MLGLIEPPADRTTRGDPDMNLKVIVHEAEEGSY